ncbi:MAG TPA: AbgT family transporter [Verrucomicrobiae bacterium]|nr:AbgT family transporter [Verrucomicrobiae bacterium]
MKARAAAFHHRGEEDGLPATSFMQRLLEWVERVGNKVPHPAIIFAWLIVGLIVLSHIFYLTGASVTFDKVNPQTHAVEKATAHVQSLITADGIRFMYSNIVSNFMGFTAVGIFIVAMLGVGVAESSGLIKVLVNKLVQISSPRALTYILVFVGVLSSVASDVGYLVLIPLGAAAFLSVGRNPLVGLAASFAAVAGLFSVNIVVKPIDGVLTEITNDSIHMINPHLTLSLTANFWFSLASVVILTVVCGLITDKLVEPRLGRYESPKELGDALAADESAEVDPADEARGLKWAAWGIIATFVVFGFLTLPHRAPLRNPETGTLIGYSPFLNHLIVFVAVAFLVAGAAYGLGARTMTGAADIVKSMENAMVSLGPLLFLLFVVSQFIGFMTYSNLATIAAVKMGDQLERAGLGPVPLLLGFVIVAALVNLLMTGIAQKWAVLAAVFVPLLMRLHVAPEAVLAAYRVSDSPFNLVSPVMPYFPIVIGVAAKYQRNAGLGTIVALMLPYLVIIQAVWIGLLLAWQALKIPWGF